jgi:hypothetical protein
MARKDKNTSLKDTARDQEGKRRKKKDGAASSVDCGHSIDVLPYLLVPPTGPTAQREMATDRFSKLRRLYKKEYGYKPVGMTEAELDAVLTAKGVNTADTWE